MKLTCGNCQRDMQISECASATMLTPECNQWSQVPPTQSVASKTTLLCRVGQKSGNRVQVVSEGLAAFSSDFRGKRLLTLLATFRSDCRDRAASTIGMNRGRGKR
jgi:hypothetical protein